MKKQGNRYSKATIPNMMICEFRSAGQDVVVVELAVQRVAAANYLWEDEGNIRKRAVDWFRTVVWSNSANDTFLVYRWKHFGARGQKGEKDLSIGRLAV
jgi:hypothetical protein